MRGQLLASLGVGFCVLALSHGAHAAPFLPVGPITDTTQSLGIFSVVVNPAFSGAAAGLGGAGYTYNPATNILTSPLLFDSNTQVDRSATTTVGSAGYTGGMVVGSPANGTVKASDLTLPPGYIPTAGENTVFTKINTFNLSNGAGTSVGAGAAAPSQPASKGEVISNAIGAGIGNPASDFPATSFFDVFVEVNVPTVGTPFINTTPLIIKNPSITTFPPVVVYTHGNSSAVPIMFTAGNAYGAPAGTVFGLITLAGHAAGYGRNGATGGGNDPQTGLPATDTNFQAAYQTELSNPAMLMPLPAQYSSWSTFVPSVPEPTSLSLVALGLLAMGRRGRRVAA